MINHSSQHMTLTPAYYSEALKNMNFIFKGNVDVLSEIITFSNSFPRVVTPVEKVCAIFEFFLKNYFLILGTAYFQTLISFSHERMLEELEESLGTCLNSVNFRVCYKLFWSNRRNLIGFNRVIDGNWVGPAEWARYWFSPKFQIYFFCGWYIFE